MVLTEKQREYQRDYYRKNREKRLSASNERGNQRKEEKRTYDAQRRAAKGEELREYDRERSKHHSSRVNQMLQRAKARAVSSGIPFSITRSDISIPEFCPVLGIRLDWHDKRGGSPNSPSLDRIIPSLGYIPGNVQCISKRANCIKSDATADEIRRVLHWIESSLPEDRPM